MRMIDGGESDDKLICVPIDDRRWEDVQDISDMNKHTLKEIKHFFEIIKHLKGKPVEVVVNGFEDKAAAASTIERAKQLYTDTK